MFITSIIIFSSSYARLSRDCFVKKPYDSSPLSPISRHVVEEICSSPTSETEAAKTTTQIARRSPLSILPTHHEDNVVKESFSDESASQDPQGHSCSRTCGCGSLDVEGGRTPRSPANRPFKFFPEFRMRKLSNTAQSPRFVLRLPGRPRGIDSHNRNSLTDLSNSTTYKNSQFRRRASSFSAVLPNRLTSSQHIEAALEQHDNGRPHDVPIASSPRTNSCLSPISHILLPEPFNGSADSTPVVGSPRREARSIEHTVRRHHQDIEREAYPSRVTFVSILSFSCSPLNCLVVMLNLPAQSGYLLLWLVILNCPGSVSLEQAPVAHRFGPSTQKITVRSVTRRLDRSMGMRIRQDLGSPRKSRLKGIWTRLPKPGLVQAPTQRSLILGPSLGTPRFRCCQCVRLPLVQLGSRWSTRKKRLMLGLLPFFVTVSCTDHSLARMRQRRLLSIAILRLNNSIAPKLKTTALFSTMSSCAAQ